MGKLENTTVENTNTLSSNLGMSGNLPLAQDAAVLSTQTESVLLNSEVLKCTILLLESLSKEFISSAIWVLALSSAKTRARELGVKNSDEILLRLVEAVGKGRSKFMDDFLG